MVVSLDGHTPVVADTVFMADTARVSGQVSVADRASIWYGASIRGDVERIEIKAGSNIQDNVSVHADAGYPVTIGREVTVGHNAVLHGCTIGDGAMIGIGAIVLNGAVVGQGSIVAAGALVPEGAVIPDGSLAVGVPAKVRRELTVEQIVRLRVNAGNYQRLASRYLDG